MKKLIIALMAVLLVAGTALAVKQINLSNTVMRQADVRIHYDELGKATAEVTVVYDVCDIDCNFITQASKKFTWADMPPNIRNTMATFLKHVDQEFRNEQIDENNSDLDF